jgi:hypothetical protein
MVFSILILKKNAFFVNALNDLFLFLFNILRLHHLINFLWSDRFCIIKKRRQVNRDITEERKKWSSPKSKLAFLLLSRFLYTNFNYRVVCLTGT